MINIRFVLLPLLLFNFCDKAHKSKDIKEGMSIERLSRIDIMLNKAIDSKEIPGAVALVKRNGKTVYQKSFGIANPDNNRAISENDIFRIASMTKAITSLAVLMLWEEGKFFLDDPISKYIPSFTEVGILDDFNPKDSTYTSIPPKNEITIRHLLTHTSGIGYGEIDGNPQIRSIYWKRGLRDIFSPGQTMEEITNAIAAQPIHHEPGKRYTYSLGLDVLGYFVELMSGVTFSEFLRTRIFDPLDMKDTYFTLPEEKHKRLVPVLTKDGDEWAIYNSSFYDVNYPLKSKNFFSGGAGLSSTVQDYAKFLNLFLNNGNSNGRQIIGKKTCELVYENQMPENEDISHGLAFGVLLEKNLEIGTGGSEGTLTWGGYFNTSYFADPKENIIGIIYKQTFNIGNDNTSQRFRELVFQAVIE
jgi:CubicO group peptidase (beta-lactamase class C family)